MQLEGIRKRYGAVEVLQGIDLDVRRGEWVAIMGPSGSGKSTLLNLIACLERPSTGHMWLDGMEVAGLQEHELDEIRREKVGLVFQQFHLIPYLTALENVMLAQYYHSMPDAAEARRALAQVEMAHREDAYPHQLSGGEKQRVCVARAIINYPALILADEPSGNLDADNQRTVMELFRELHRQGHTLVVVTHDAEVARQAERQLVLRQGRFQED